ncbi:hypothetical protein PTKIN_Ptkin17bG0045700 [Pterospermum kingtungense]
MVRTFRVVWRLAKDFEVSILDSNLSLFKFASLRDKKRVLEGAPWSFERQLLMFQEYDGDLRPSDYTFGKGTFWIRIHGLPLNLMSMEIAERLGKKIGTLLEVDSSSSRNIRLKVEIDVFKPSHRFVTVVRGGGKDNIWGRLGYERLPLFYYNCGHLGHREFECDLIDESTDASDVKQYGDWLRATPGNQSEEAEEGESQAADKNLDDGTEDHLDSDIIQEDRTAPRINLLDSISGFVDKVPAGKAGAFNAIPVLVDSPDQLGLEKNNFQESSRGCDKIVPETQVKVDKTMLYGNVLSCMHSNFSEVEVVKKDSLVPSGPLEVSSHGAKSLDIVALVDVSILGLEGDSSKRTSVGRRRKGKVSNEVAG